MQKITPFFWFNDNAEKAVKFYTSIFKKSKIGKIARYDEAGEKVAGRPAGSVMTIEFEIEGQDFIALNGGPHFKFSEAVSFVVSCKSQTEVDYYWNKLSAGGKEVQLAQRQVRPVMADCAYDFGRADERQGSREITTRHGGYAQDGET
jgi:predicted 3-demethylubiquinone-9 3-methyltransferase (glyoxalase superfamily)